VWKKTGKPVRDGRKKTERTFSSTSVLKNIAKYFRTRTPVSAADSDGWRARELMAPLFMGDDDEI
jgi:hypothetical protein